MKALQLFKVAAIIPILLASSPSFATDPCPSLDKLVSYPIMVGRQHIFNCSQLKQIIPEEELDRILNHAGSRMTGEKTASITPSDCKSLNEIVLSSSNANQSWPVLNKYFGKDIQNWNESDFRVFEDSMLKCQEEGKYRKYRKDSYKKLILKESNALRKENINQNINLAINAVYESKARSEKKAEKYKVAKTYPMVDPEDGWKAAKWGMSRDEIKDALYEQKTVGRSSVYVSKYDGSECKGTDLASLSYIDYDIEKRLDRIGLIEDLTSMTCRIMGSSSFRETLGFSHFLFLRGKFCGKITTVNMKDESVRNTVIEQLSTMYPKGKTSYYEFNYGELQGRAVKLKLPVFKYQSRKVKVFTTDTAVYIYNLDAMNELLTLPGKAKKQEEEKKKREVKKII